MTPIVSILLPVFQGERYIEQAIQSVLQQTVADWELVLSDNASTDRTMASVEGFCDDRIRIFRQSNNIGMRANWSFVLEQGRADLACVLSADDYFEPNHLESRIALLEGQPGCLFAHGAFKVVDETGRLLRVQDTGYPQETPVRNFLARNFQANYVNASSAVFRLARVKQLGIGFDPRYRLMMDWRFWMDMAFHSTLVLSDPQPTSSYREHPASGTGQFRQGPEWTFEQYTVLSDLLAERASQWKAHEFDPEVMQRQLLRGLWPFALQRLRRGRLGQFRRAWKLYRRAFTPVDAFRQLPAYLGRWPARVGRRKRSV